MKAEIHERTTAPLFTLAFGLIALAFLGQPHSNRQNRGAAIASVVVACLLLRAGGFAATAVGRNLNGAIPFMYAVPLIGIAFGIYRHDARPAHAGTRHSSRRCGTGSWRLRGGRPGGTLRWPASWAAIRHDAAASSASTSRGGSPPRWR